MTDVLVLPGDALHGHSHEADVPGYVAGGKNDCGFVFVQLVFIVLVRF